MIASVRAVQVQRVGVWEMTIKVLRRRTDRHRTQPWQRCEKVVRCRAAAMRRAKNPIKILKLMLVIQSLTRLPVLTLG